MAVGLLPLYVLLVLAATAVDPPAARRIAFIGLVSFALGVAAYAVNPGSDDLADIARAAAGSNDAFFRVNTGLLLLGVGMCGVATLYAIRSGSAIASGRALALLGVGGFAVWVLGPLVARSGGWRPALAAVGLAALALVGGAAARRLGEMGRRSPDRPGEWPGARGGSLGLAAAFGVGALAAVAAPHAGVVFLGLGLSAAADFLDRRRRGLGRVPWLPAAALVLAPAWWFMAAVAGPVGLRLSTLPEIPFSPTAERLLALPLGLVAWAFLGLWPMHRLFPDRLLAPLGIALWLRVASPAVAGGLEHWQPLLVPLGVLGVWGAAVTGRGAAACNALAFVALVSEAPTSVPAAIVLGATALALRIAPARTPRAAGERLAWMLAAVVLPFTFEAGFRAQVTYTLVAGAGTALACWTSVGRSPDQVAA
jgi:hypothetical protein